MGPRRRQDLPGRPANDPPMGRPGLPGDMPEAGTPLVGRGSGGAGGERKQDGRWSRDEATACPRARERNEGRKSRGGRLQSAPIGLPGLAFAQAPATPLSRRSREAKADGGTGKEEGTCHTPERNRSRERRSFAGRENASRNRKSSPENERIESIKKSLKSSVASMFGVRKKHFQIYFRVDALQFEKFLSYAVEAD